MSKYRLCVNPVGHTEPLFYSFDEYPRDAAPFMSPVASVEGWREGKELVVVVVKANTITYFVEAIEEDECCSGE